MSKELEEKIERLEKRVAQLEVERGAEILELSAMFKSLWNYLLRVEAARRLLDRAYPDPESFVPAERRRILREGLHAAEDQDPSVAARIQELYPVLWDDDDDDSTTPA